MGQSSSQLELPSQHNPAFAGAEGTSVELRKGPKRITTSEVHDTEGPRKKRKKNKKKKTKASCLSEGGVQQNNVAVEAPDSHPTPLSCRAEADALSRCTLARKETQALIRRKEWENLVAEGKAYWVRLSNGRDGIKMYKPGQKKKPLPVDADQGPPETRLNFIADLRTVEARLLREEIAASEALNMARDDGMHAQTRDIASSTLATRQNPEPQHQVEANVEQVRKSKKRKRRSKSQVDPEHSSGSANRQALDYRVELETEDKGKQVADLQMHQHSTDIVLKQLQEEASQSALDELGTVDDAHLGLVNSATTTWMAQHEHSEEPQLSHAVRSGSNPNMTRVGICTPESRDEEVRSQPNRHEETASLQIVQVRPGTSMPKNNKANSRLKPVRSRVRKSTSKPEIKIIVAQPWLQEKRQSDKFGPASRFTDREKATADRVFNEVMQEQNMSSELLIERLQYYPRAKIFRAKLEAALPHRPSASLRKFVKRRWCVPSEKARTEKNAWTEKEDQELYDAVATWSDHWYTISVMVGRPIEACQDRWTSHLRYDEKALAGAWTRKEQDSMLDALDNCLLQIKSQYQDPGLHDPVYFENLVDWGRVAEGTTRRNAGQCRAKFAKIKEFCEADKDSSLSPTVYRDGTPKRLSSMPSVLIKQLPVEVEKGLANHNPHVGTASEGDDTGFEGDDAASERSSPTQCLPTIESILSDTRKLLPQLEIGDYYDIFVDIYSAYPDPTAVPKFEHRNIMWSSIAYHNPNSRFNCKAFNSALRWVALEEAVATWPAKHKKLQRNLDQADTVMAKALVLANLLEKQSKGRTARLTRNFRVNFIGKTQDEIPLITKEDILRNNIAESQQREVQRDPKPEPVPDEGVEQDDQMVSQYDPSDRIGTSELSNPKEQPEIIDAKPQISEEMSDAEESSSDTQEPEQSEMFKTEPSEPTAIPESPARHEQDQPGSAARVLAAPIVFRSALAEDEDPDRDPDDSEADDNNNTNNEDLQNNPQRLATPNFSPVQHLMNVTEDAISSVNSQRDVESLSGTPALSPVSFMRRCQRIGRRQHQTYTRRNRGRGRNNQ